MSFFKCDIKKIDLMKYVKENLPEYVLTEEDPEYQERYGFYTSASYNIKPNKFKGSELKSSLHINRDYSSVLVLGGNKIEANDLLDRFNRPTINKTILIHLLKEIYDIASRLRFYDGSNIDKIIKDFEEWLNIENILRHDIDASLKYGLVGKTTTGRVKAIKGHLSLSEHYYIDNKLNIITCHTLEFPMKGLFKLTISVLHEVAGPKIYLTLTENGSHQDVSEINVFRQLIEARFLDRYQAAIKKWIGIEDTKFSEDYLLLLEMVKF